MTPRDLYLRVSAAVEGVVPASVKADIDSAFADYEAASNEPEVVEIGAANLAPSAYPTAAGGSST